MFRHAARAIGSNAYLLLAVGPLFWAGNHIVGRAIAGHVPPGGLAVLRWTLAGLVLLPFAFRHLRRDWAALNEKPWTVVMLAMAGGGIFGTLQFIGLQYTTALNVAVFNSTVPAFIVLAGGLIFRDPVRFVQVIGILISLSGALVIVSKGDPAALTSLEFNYGDLLIVANMALFAVYSACMRLKPELHWMTFMIALAVVSAIANVPFAVLEHMSGEPLEPTWMTVGAVVYVGIFASTIAYACWSRGIELIGAARAGVFLHLVPLYGALLSSLLLGEAIRLDQIAGLGLILSGVALASRQRKPKPKLRQRGAPPPRSSPAAWNG
jgi:drug/metabolite transporter (DMT)-like permease